MPGYFQGAFSGIFVIYAMGKREMTYLKLTVGKNYLNDTFRTGNTRKRKL